MNNEIQIIGGAKTGYNLYRFLEKEGIAAELFYFSNEFSEKKKVGYEFNKIEDPISPLKTVIISSETAFNHLSKMNRKNFSTHYFLRGKENISKIACEIRTSFIPELSPNNLSFPVALKPRESMADKVPFKFKRVETKEELDELEDVIDQCLVQPYLNDEKFRQMAVAGYFNGNKNSLIAVQQKNQYPKGISAYVIHKSSENKILIDQIESYLKKINYKGFIEFEFKQNLVTNENLLMDINPRPWGWFYYYLNSIQNFKEVFLENKPVKLKVKKVWVNSPRLGMAMLKGNFNFPRISDVLTNNICYEPYFK